MKPTAKIAVLLAALSIPVLAAASTLSKAVGSRLAPRVRAVGLMVNADVGQGESGMEELAFFGTFAKTSLALKLELPEGGIIDLVQDDSSLTTFTDDKGSNLLKEDGFFGPFEMGPRTVEGGRGLVFVAASERTPDPGASRITAKGEVAVLVATEKQKSRAADVALAKGTKATAGPFAFEIVETGPPDWGDGWSFTLEAKQDLSAIVTYALIDGEGNEVELSTGMSMTFGDTRQVSLVAPKEYAKATLSIEHWKSPKVQKIPFDVSVGLGLR